MFPSPPEELAQMAVSRYGEMVYRLAFFHTGSRQDADDIYQEVFLRLVRRPNVFEDEEHLRAWLIRVTVNCAIPCGAPPGSGEPCHCLRWKKQRLRMNRS